jgi:choice-of-anchor B domain-containing protein
MRWLLCFVIAVLPVLGVAQYDRQGVRLLSRIPLNQMPGSPASGAGCTGYTSPSGREYAIMGVRNGTIIVDITAPTTPVIVGHIPGPSSAWHEVAVLGDFAYAVTEGGGGMQIIDLREVDQGVVTLANTYTGNNLGRVHTVQTNPATNSIFLNGSNRGFVILDATNPIEPVEVGRWTQRYVHDCQVVVYQSGPYAGREIAFLCCGSNGLYIMDVTDRSNLVVLSSLQYIESGGYCHSGQLTPDKKYFLINDEFDETNGIVDHCTTHIVDVQDLSNPIYKGTFTNFAEIVDHNSYFRDGYLYLAAYRGGLRVYEASDPLNMKETGYFDTYPAGVGFNYDGNWDVFAGFASRNIVLSDINRGLFVVDASEAAGRGAPILSVLPWNGQLTGGPTELRDVDDTFVELRRTTTRGLGFLVNYRTAYSPPVSIDFTVVGKGPGTLLLEVKNRSTGQFELVGQFTLGSATTTHTINGIPAASYVASNGDIELRVREAVEPNLRSIVYRIDQIKVEVRR